MKVTLEISDKHYPFFMELIKSLGFVKQVKKEETTDEIKKPVSHLMSEKVLAKEWLTPEEDKAWKNL
jgi:hypothetical protein